MGLAQSLTEDDEAGLADAARAGDPKMTCTEIKDVAGSTVVVYNQGVKGIDIFNARMAVHVNPNSRAVTSVQSSMHGEIAIRNERAKKGEPGKKLSNADLKKFGIELKRMDRGRVSRQVVYRYEPDQRIEAEDGHEGCFGGHVHNSPELPPVPNSFKKGEHYIVDEVLFEASLGGDEPPVNWRALVEPESGTVLYVRALVGAATGLVYYRDPQTQTGAAVTGASSNAVLNPFRTSVSLQGLISDSPQPLEGEYVKVVDTGAPAIDPPEVPSPSGGFNYDVRTDDFSAVNAYFHCDRLFRTMAEYGFDVFAYFDGTTFPVPVDHRSLGSTVNAQAPGNAAGNGLEELRFALLQSGEPVGIATSNRVVWHEFGHALLWDHVNSPNFGFAHSAGDSLAAILNDPGSNEADRFDTFPWVQEATPIGRRHDRAVADGWAWFGPQYNTQYQGEQILCTTMFRFYQSIGGDSDHLGTQRRAATTSAYLIFKAIGLLSSTTQYPEVFVTNLQNADLTTTSFKGIPGGALHKVVRWAFEKQGLFHPGTNPSSRDVMEEGEPPAVDVYIDDGRGGEYQYLRKHWKCEDMWVRRLPDGGLAHERPVIGLTNYMYVRVKNRGIEAAYNVSVDAYHCLPGTGLAFPDDWSPMMTASLPAPAPIAPGGEAVIGPFAFVPTEVGHECLLAIAHADGDPGNDTTLTGTIPEGRFVPFDNNIGQRNVSPIAPSLHDLIRFFRVHPFWIRNPLKGPAVCRIEIELPRFLRRLGWGMRITSPGGARFELGPKDRRKVVLEIEPGRNFSVQDVRRAIAINDHEFTVLTYLDDELSGGMSYEFSLDAHGEDDPNDGDDEDKPVARLPITIEEILKKILETWPIPKRPIVGGPLPPGPIRRVRLELDLVGEDDASGDPSGRKA